ncbi:ABC transporter substrate-binding protein [Nocardia stercoris]|uniref:ABC transporter substrate-binding protein n=1 Tax=Nocardia stercoris TaxID=2483361 RepID=A0A3M2LBV2_9NOCA|nr:ABC transporter substrate-binding protein [Nocardia stercoris]RMI34894.1 ABC transporter substrate-binding protein [Nocardia stercoris]
MRILTRLLPAVVAVAALVLSGCSADDGSSATRAQIKTLRIGTIGSGNVLTGPLGFANQRNVLLPALQPLGVDKIEVSSFPNGPDLNQALVGGQLDVATYGDTPALVARGSGLKTRLLGFATVGLNAGVVAKDPNIHTLKDLAGKKIGVQLGSYIDRYLEGALQAEGVAAGQLIHLLSTDAEAPLSNGDVDAVALPDTNPTSYLRAFLAKGFHQVDSIVDNHPGLAGTSSAVSSQDFLDSHADFGTTWQTALNAANKYAHEHWDDYVAYEVSQSKLPEAVVRAAAQRDNFPEESFPARGITLLTGTKQFLVDQKKIRTDFDLEGWFYRPKQG